MTVDEGLRHLERVIEALDEVLKGRQRKGAQTIDPELAARLQAAFTLKRFIRDLALTSGNDVAAAKAHSLGNRLVDLLDKYEGEANEQKSR